MQRSTSNGNPVRASKQRGKRGESKTNGKDGPKANEHDVRAAEAKRVSSRASAKSPHRVELLTALMALRKGDFSVRMPLGWEGLDGRIADTFNDVVELNDRMAKETARVIGAVAKGDLSQTMALEVDGRPLEGEFLRTAKTVNTMVDQLRSFASEVTRVAREVGTEGKLGGQADMKGVAGTRKDLTGHTLVLKQVSSSERLFDEASLSLHRRVAEPMLAGKKVLVVDLDVRGEKIKGQEAELHRQALDRVAQRERDAQQARLFALFGQAPALIASLRGPRHIYDFANASYLELCGAQEVVGLSAKDVHPDLPDRSFDELLDQAYESGEPVAVGELRAVTRVTRVTHEAPSTKEERYFNFVAQPVRDPAGAVDSILVHAVEVTAQVLAQLALRQSEAKFRRAWESGMIGMAFMTIDGRFTEANDGFLDMVGYDREAVAGGSLRWREMTPPEWAAADERALGELRKSGVATPYEKEFLRRDGARQPVVIGAAHLEGSTTEAVAFILDDTERKQADREREGLLRSLARSNEDLDRFAYATSHDLKAPLRGIGYLVEWLEEDLGPTLNEAASEKLNLLRVRAQRMSALIDGILNYSRAGRLRVEPQLVDVRTLMEESLVLLEVPPRSVIDLAPDLPVLETDRASLQQVFLNLVGNALKHAGRPDAVVRVQATLRGSVYEFVVSDNGPGVAPEYHQKIWELFQTLNARDRVEGAGIGLSVVKRIVESRGGRAWVESAVGKGAAFHFTWSVRGAAP